MAAIHDPDGVVDIEELGNAVKEQLPSFARPLFVRLVKQLDITGNIWASLFRIDEKELWFDNKSKTLIINLFSVIGTYKLKKFNLQREGYNISAIEKTGCDDKLFFLHPKTGAYEHLTFELFNNISNGLIRL